MIEIIRHPTNMGTTIPDNALLFYDQALNEYYVITDNLGNVLTWSTA